MRATYLSFALSVAVTVAAATQPSCMGPAGVSNLGGDAPATGSSTTMTGADGDESSSASQGITGGGNTAASDPNEEAPPTSAEPNRPSDGNRGGGASSPNTTGAKSDGTVHVRAVATNVELDANIWAPNLPRYAFWDDDKSDARLPPAVGATAVFLLTNDASRCPKQTLAAANRQSGDWLLTLRQTSAQSASVSFSPLTYGAADANHMCALNGNNKGALVSTAAQSAVNRSLCVVIDPTQFGGPITLGQQVCVDVSEAAHCNFIAYFASASPRLPCQ